MGTELPSLDLLRSLTDEHVLRALMDERRLTRAEIASRTGISKPTVSESMRRLTDAGMVLDTGERTTGRGRVGSYYALRDDIGSAMVVGIAPDGIVAETVDVYGAVICRHARNVRRSARPAQVTDAIAAAAADARVPTSGPARLAVVSAAEPVDRTSGRLVHLPDAPFLVGDVSAADALAAVVAGPVTVDNDVNWAALAERHAAIPERLDDFAYLYLGDGLGCAIVHDGEVRRGHHGLAGEVAHVVTVGPRGRVTRFTEVFAELDLRHAHSTAIDSDALARAVQGADARARRVRTTVAAAVSGVLAAIVALADPELVIIGGRWGTQPSVIEAIRADFAGQPRHVPVRAANVTREAPLTGARLHAIHNLRAAILAESHQRNAASLNPGGSNQRGFGPSCATSSLVDSDR